MVGLAAQLERSYNKINEDYVADVLSSSNHESMNLTLRGDSVNYIFRGIFLILFVAILFLVVLTN